jgi:hypothetical protein
MNQAVGRVRTGAVVGIALVAFTHCSSSSSGGGNSGGFGTGDGGSVASGVTSLHRGDAKACSVPKSSSNTATDQCAKDDDCGATNLCACRGEEYGTPSGDTANVCAVGGNCRLDIDCNQYCSPSATTASACPGGAVAYYCHVIGDECTKDDDCTVNASAGAAKQQCYYDGSAKHWKCRAYEPCGK